MGYLYIATTVGWSRFFELPADQMGSFLEGAFAPLAFLWLVIGYFLQQEELQQNTDALRAQAVEIERATQQQAVQAEKMAASEQHARQEAFLRVADHVRSQLGTIASFLFLSSQGGTGDGAISREEQAALFARLSMKDPEVFSRSLMELNFMTEGDDNRYELFYGTEIRARHCNNFIHTFERLLSRAEQVDEDSLLTNALRASAHGLVYGLMCRHRENAPPEFADIERTGHGIFIS
ncbi:MAG: hypothetical protein AAF515_12895 [Pseudomonadota bacterium]